MRIKDATRHWDIVRGFVRDGNFKYFRTVTEHPGMLELFGTYPCDTCGKPTVAPNTIMVDCTKEFLESKNLLMVTDGMVFGECTELDDDGNSHCDLCPKETVTV
jgi:hypothetical protein